MAASERSTATSKPMATAPAPAGSSAGSSAAARHAASGITRATVEVQRLP